MARGRVGVRGLGMDSGEACGGRLQRTKLPLPRLMAATWRRWTPPVTAPPRRPSRAAGEEWAGQKSTGVGRKGGADRAREDRRV
jgi:hypothetical protein